MRCTHRLAAAVRGLRPHQPQPGAVHVLGRVPPAGGGAGGGGTKDSAPTGAGGRGGGRGRPPGRGGGAVQPHLGRCGGRHGHSLGAGLPRQTPVRRAARQQCAGRSREVQGGAWLRRVDPNGRAATAPTGPLAWHTHKYDSVAVLRGGYLAMAASATRTVLLLQLGLTPPWAGAIAPAPGTLSSDMGELLDRQPEGSADVEVEVGGQVFAAHRGVLAARSPYFRQRLDPGAGFADGRAPRLSLPDADPAAFGAVLRVMYTDSAGPVPPELLQPVGELADRLLLRGERGGAAAVGGAAQRQLRGAAGRAQGVVAGL